MKKRAALVPVPENVAAAPAFQAAREEVDADDDASDSTSEEESDESEPETEGALHHRHKAAPDHPAEGRILLSGVTF